MHRPASFGSLRAPGGWDVAGEYVDVGPRPPTLSARYKPHPYSAPWVIGPTKRAVLGSRYCHLNRLTRGDRRSDGS